MIPLIRRDLVSRKGWVEDAEFVDLVAMAQSAPGPIAVNTAVVTGFKIRGIPGAVVATLGSALPSFLVILAFATVLLRFKGSKAIEAVFTGMRPAIFGLLVSAVWQVARTSVKRKTDVAFAAVGAALLLFLKVNPMVVVLLAALGGLALGRSTKGSPSAEEALSKGRTTPGEGD